MALDVEVEVPVLVRIRLILLADDELNAETTEELSWDAPRRRIAKTGSDCMILSEWIDRASCDGKRKVAIVRMQCHQFTPAEIRSSALIFPGRKSFSAAWRSDS